ncbi:MAG: hypothetical protein IJW93_02235 [Clostridia bacterium]|nr:hypothetical protein [Clostridia bacterium]
MNNCQKKLINPETGENELKPVVNTFVNEATELVHVFADGEEIVCTNEHPFYSPVKGWITACKLRAGDILVSLNGNYVIVEQVQHEILEAPIKVYNFEVEDFHTYFVGDGDGVLVHNVCSDFQHMSKQEANQIKNQIKNSQSVTFKSKSDAVSFINKYFPTFKQEVRGHRSAQGWHFDSPHINGVNRNHINIYSKHPKFDTHIFWDE